LAAALLRRFIIKPDYSRPDPVGQPKFMGRGAALEPRTRSTSAPARASRGRSLPCVAGPQQKCADQQI
jgi:hypothetical protein